MCAARPGVGSEHSQPAHTEIEFLTFENRVTRNGPTVRVPASHSMDSRLPRRFFHFRSDSKWSPIKFMHCLAEPIIHTQRNEGASFSNVITFSACTFMKLKEHPSPGAIDRLLSLRNSIRFSTLTVSICPCSRPAPSSTTTEIGDKTTLHANETITNGKWCSGNLSPWEVGERDREMATCYARSLARSSNANVTNFHLNQINSKSPIEVDKFGAHSLSLSLPVSLRFHFPLFSVKASRP